MQVNVNDYLDIYCPHYNSSGPGGGAEQYVLYMVSRAGYHACNASQGFKRWECNRPHAPHSPIKFSEKFQRYSAFSLGYEFHAGHEYYYICELQPAGGLPRVPGRAGRQSPGLNWSDIPYRVWALRTSGFQLRQGLEAEGGVW